ncbi:MAG TPA: VCBS repeat-containing protein [Acidobacteriaceae bacterium]|nr:VCBS repeat-containing protein [Acidobacteriaceae bacterium]
MWHIVPCDRRPFVPALCFFAFLALLQAGCSGNQTAGKPGAAKTAASGSQAAPAPGASAAGAANGQAADSHPEVTPVAAAEANRGVEPLEGPIPLSPPDGKWLTDEFGRKYFVHRIKKIPQAWIWVEEGKRVQLARGLMFDVVSNDETSFDVKIYGTDAKMAANIAEAGRRVPTPEERAKIAATYRTEVAPSDRLTFTPFSQGLPTHGQWRQGFAVADVNEDGNLDIVHGPPRKGGSTPAIFLGNGQGGWRRWNEATYPSIPFDYGDIAVADFNGDRHPDLAIASHLRGITVVVGDGKGNFRPWSEGIEFEADDQDKPIFSSRAITVVDWNGDGRTDVLAWGEGPRLAATRIEGGGGEFSSGSRDAVVYLNKGDGTWQKKAAESSGRSYGDSIRVADFNGDKRLDFAAASSLTNNRTLLYLAQEDGSWKGSSIDLLRPQATFRGIAEGDFNRDGRTDLAVGYASTELGIARTGIDLLLARPDGSWDRRPLGSEEGRAGVWSLGAGDLDGDGALDLVGITGEGSGWVFLGDGKGSFTREQSPELAPQEPGCTGYHVELVDLDKDGAAELVASYAGEGSLSPLGGVGKCASGGSLRAWKASRQGAR